MTDREPQSASNGERKRRRGTRRRYARRQGNRVRAGFVRRLRGYFLAGILVAAPLAITAYLAWLIVTVLDQSVAPLIPAQYNPESYLPFGIPGIGVVLLLVVVTAIGALTRGILGRWMIRTGERLLSRMPVVRSLYGALKQIFETVLARQSQAFRRAVLLQYPRRGIWAIGFVTGGTEAEVKNLTLEKTVNVFLPTTPNPTSGFLLVVPRGDVIELQMTVEEAIKMVISGGIVTPPAAHPATE